jgi:alpha-ribazole phosphatase
VDPRKTRRLARHIRQQANRHALPREVWVSPLARARDVGRSLRRMGFTVHVDVRLQEMDFGVWDGCRWEHIAAPELGIWAANLLDHRPGGGESLRQLAARARAFAGETRGVRLLVTHGGWINALRHVPPGMASLAAADWPAPPMHGGLVRWSGP